MIRNDYYNMNTHDVRRVIGMCEKCDVKSIAIEGYEWLIYNGIATEAEYLRLMALYHRKGDLFNLNRIENRYNSIYDNQ